MIELFADDADPFLDRWGAFHDALVEAVEFDIEASVASIALRAQEKTAGWTWRQVRIVVEGLSEFSFRQQPGYDIRTVFEAAVMWADSTILFTLDAPPPAEATADGFRASGSYFGGTRLLYEVPDGEQSSADR